MKQRFCELHIPVKQKEAVMHLLSWNVAGRLKKCNQQLELVRNRNPDIVALQEVRPSSYNLLHAGLDEIGLEHIIESVSLATHFNRRFGELIASRYPQQKLPATDIDIPYPERVLSANISTPWGMVELHTTHIPPGSSNGWIKIETLEGIYRRLACASKIPRILCGDFNTPQAEFSDGTVVTWGQSVNSERIIKLVRNYERWDAGERNILIGLAKYDLPDIFRMLHGYGVQNYSWRVMRKGREIARRRFDHIFASSQLNPIECKYLHAFRNSGASDHSAIEARFEPMSLI